MSNKNLSNNELNKRFRKLDAEFAKVRQVPGASKRASKPKMPIWKQKRYSSKLAYDRAMFNFRQGRKRDAERRAERERQRQANFERSRKLAEKRRRSKNLNSPLAKIRREAEERRRLENEIKIAKILQEHPNHILPSRWSVRYQEGRPYYLNHHEEDPKKNRSWKPPSRDDIDKEWDIELEQWIINNNAREEAEEAAKAAAAEAAAEAAAKTRQKRTQRRSRQRQTKRTKRRPPVAPRPRKGPPVTPRTRPLVAPRPRKGPPRTRPPVTPRKRPPVAQKPKLPPKPILVPRPRKGPSPPRSSGRQYPEFIPPPPAELPNNSEDNTSHNVTPVTSRARQSSRSNLFSAIRQGTKLRKIKQNKKPHVKPPSNMGQALRRAMAARRTAIEANNSGNSDSNSGSWSNESTGGSRKKYRSRKRRVFRKRTNKKKRRRITRKRR